MKRSVPLVTALVAASALALAGCAGTAAPEGTSADGKLQVAREDAAFELALCA